MLVASTPSYGDFEVRNNNDGPPRVISEIRKRDIVFATPNIRPKLTGDLLVKYGQDKKWWPRRVTVLGGQLHVSGVQGEDAPSAVRLPLRHLSLRAGSLPNSLSLCKSQTTVLTLQTANERLFDFWVKAIAIELIRQTPLYDIKYLDILTLAECWKRKDHHDEKDWNYNYVNSNNSTECLNCNPNEHFNNNNNNYPDQITQENNNTPYKSNSSKQAIIACDAVDFEKAPPSSSCSETIIVVENLLKKCQNVENYVPVKEKLVLFESLCKMGRKVRSSEDVSLKIEIPGTKRARSMHDISNFGAHIAVREICKYFESKQDEKTATKEIAAIARSGRRNYLESQFNINNINNNNNNVQCSPFRKMLTQVT